MAAKVLQMHHIDVHAVYGRWLAGPRILITRPVEGNELVPRAHSTIQNGGCSIQDTVKKHAGYSIQNTTNNYANMQAYKDTKMQDTRMQRIQDAGIKMQRIRDAGSN